jgi:hypothetical protein
VAFDLMQGLWIGDRLSNMERMSINSFLKNGHPYDLYTYGPVEGVPEGVTVRDANAIIPWSEAFLNRGGYSTFSDFFRWKLIHDLGGWWVDTDAVCLRPFDFEADYVFFGGKGKPGSDDCVTSGLFKAPAGSLFTEYGWDSCEVTCKETMAWGACGPPLITEAVEACGLQDHILPGKLVFPIFYTRAVLDFTERHEYSKTYSDLVFGDAYSVHLFNEMWRLAGADKNGYYPGSIYQHLQERFK